VSTLRIALVGAAALAPVLVLVRRERRSVRAQCRAWQVWQLQHEGRPVTGWGWSWIWGGDRAARRGSGTGAAPGQHTTTTTETSAQGQAPERTRRAA